MSQIIVPSALLASDINAYSDAGDARKQAFHKHGAAFLKKVALHLNLGKGEFNIRSNQGGIAVSGEVTLHADHLYVQLHESCLKPGIELMYRSCKGQKDCTGGPNNFVQLSQFREVHTQERVLKAMTEIIERERESA